MTTMQRSELAEHVAAAIIGLPTRLRTVFVLAHVQQMPRSEIAAVLGISDRRVDRRMVRALVACRNALEGRGIDLDRPA